MTTYKAIPPHTEDLHVQPGSKKPGAVQIPSLQYPNNQSTK
jgi:hypothetical protein